VTDAVVALQGIEVHLGGRRVLHGVDLNLPAGSLTAVLGPNGAGKSTLLAVLATLRRPAAGAARIAGHPLPRGADAARARLGFVAHEPRLYPDLTARENVRLSAWLQGLPDPDRAAAAALDSLDLTVHADRLVATLSHGTARRVAIARALAHEPVLLLLDEPYDGLDAASAAALDAALARCVDAGGAVVMASHDRERAARHADRVVLLDRGVVAWSGAPRAEAGGFAAACAAIERGQALVAAATAGDFEPFDPAEAAPEEPVGPRRARPGALATVAALAAKDLRIERRGLVALPPMVLFGIVTAAVISRAIPAGGPDAASLAAATLWVAALLGATLGFGRSVALEVEGGALSGLLASPIDRGALFLGKWLAAWLLASLMGGVAAVATALFLGRPLATLPAAWAVVALGLAGWTSAGLLLATLASAARSRDLLLPVILYPLMLPLVPPAVRAATAAFGGDAAALPASLALLLAFDAVYVVVGWMAFPVVADALGS